MFQNKKFIGRGIWAEPEVARNSVPGARQRSETGSSLISPPFDYAANYLLGLVEYVPLLDFSSDISRNRSAQWIQKSDSSESFEV
jgi:hypothetical protein